MGEHHHHHEAPASGRRLVLVIALNLVITVAEVVGGAISGSLSLISDALHNLSDGLAVVIAWIAMRLAARPRSDRFTFGLKRIEVLTAVVNAGTLVAISIVLFVESYRRFIEPQAVAGGMMAGVASVGLIANVAGTLLLRRGSKQNLNLRAAYLHLFSDALSSLAVILGGIAIAAYGVTWIDPLLTVCIAVYVLWESLGILWSSLRIILLAAPGELPLAAIRRAILEIPGVERVHHLHLWQVSERDIHFEGHVVVADQQLSRAASIRQQITSLLETRFEIHHSTLQFETCDEPCATSELA